MAFDILKCNFCAKTFKQEKRFVKHLKVQHNIQNIIEHYVNIFHDGIYPTCECSKECKEKLKFYSWKRGFVGKYVRGHNARISSVFHDSTQQISFAKKRVIGYKEKKYSVWNVGLSKKIDKRIIVSSQKISETLRRKYSTNEITSWQKDKQKLHHAIIKSRKTKSENKKSPWNKGLSKENNDKIIDISKNVSTGMLRSDNLHRLKNDEIFERINKFNNQFKLISNINLYRNKYHLFHFICNACGKTQLKTLPMLETTPICFHCHPKESKAQLEIFQFVSSICGDVISCDRKIIYPKELDIYVPSMNFAIEYDGLFWHSDQFVKNDHFIEKSRLCDEKNIKLFRIFEDEWRDKRDIIESLIYKKLSPQHNQTIQNYSIKKVDKHIVKQFHNDNCIFEFKDFDESLALSINDNIISILTFNINNNVCEIVSHFDIIKQHFDNSLNIFLSFIKNAYSFQQINVNIEDRFDETKKYVDCGFKILTEYHNDFWFTDHKHRFSYVNEINNFSKIFGRKKQTLFI